MTRKIQTPIDEITMVIYDKLYDNRRNGFEISILYTFPETWTDEENGKIYLAKESGVALFEISIKDLASENKYCDDKMLQVGEMVTDKGGERKGIVYQTDEQEGTVSVRWFDGEYDEDIDNFDVAGIG